MNTESDTITEFLLKMKKGVGKLDWFMSKT